MSKDSKLKEEERIKFVKDKFYNIQQIPNPSEKLQIAAIEADPSAIYYINNPSEKIQKLAIEKDIASIRLIDNPSESVQLIAVVWYFNNNYKSLPFIIKNKKALEKWNALINMKKACE